MPSIDMSTMRLYISHSPPAPLRGCFLSPSPSPRPAANQRRRLYQTPPLRPCLRDGATQRKKERRVVFADSKGLSLTAVTLFNRFHEEPLAPPPHSSSSSSLCCDDLQFDLLDLDDDHTHHHRGPSSASRRGLRIDPATPNPSPAPGRRRRLALAFAQPSSDYLAFRARLQRDSVALESAALSQGEGRRSELSGTVAVRRDGAAGGGGGRFRQTVALRVTFDGWRTHRDVPASYMNNVYFCTQDADTFAFVVELPPVVSDESATAAAKHGDGDSGTSAAVEFCVRFQVEGDDRCYWDNNHGQNYCLRHVGGFQDPPQCPPGVPKNTSNAIPDRTKPSPAAGGAGWGKLLLDSNPEVDRYGSPRLSSGMFPEWQSWGHVDPTVPYW